jgi:hypothetical protein
MVRPRSFGPNSQTCATNRFQHGAAQCDPESASAAAEFEALARGIADAGPRVCVVEDTPVPVKPDAVFPNNWVSFHSDGTVVLYPMMAPNRRGERRLDVLAAVEARLGFKRRRLVDLSAHEQRGQFLEGTGSLVLDHVQRMAYACRSARTDESLVHTWCQLLGYEPVLFDAYGIEGVPIYHTNVLLSIGAHWVVVCPEVIADADRSRVLERLRRDREVIEITRGAMEHFAANVLELRTMVAGDPGERLLMMSERACSALRGLHSDGWKRLTQAVDRVLAVPVPTIENIGGGGVRCMLAEVPESKN